MATTTPIKYLNIKQVCEALNVSPSTIWRWSKQGHFVKPVRLGPKVTRWEESSILAWSREKTDGES